LSVVVLPKTKLSVRLYEDRNNKEDTKPINHILYDGESHGRVYQLKITNNTDKVKTATLFGFDENFNSENYGSDRGVEVSPTSSNMLYGEVFSKSAFSPFVSSLIRVQSSNHQQVKQIVNVVSKSVIGDTVEVPIFTETYFSKNQFQDGIVDIPIEYIQDNRTKLTTEILPNTSVVITIFSKTYLDLIKLLTMEEQPYIISKDDFEDYQSLKKDYLKTKEEVSKTEGRLSMLENKKSWWEKLFSFGK